MSEPSTGQVKPVDRPEMSRLDTLRLGVWIGAMVGLIQVVLRTIFYSSRDTIAYESPHYPWMMPAAMLLMVGVVALVLSGLRSRMDARIPLFALGFVGAFEAALWIPKLHIAATAMLAAGMASVLMRSAVRFWPFFHRMVKVTTPLLMVVVLGLVATCFALPWWRERQALAALPAPPPRAPNLVFIVLDTVRTDHMGIYGYYRNNTPALEKWTRARRGVVFDQAYSSSPWSLPSHAVMFTGRWRHELDVAWKRALEDSELTLAEFLREHGYDTGGFVGNLSYCVRGTGLDQGFTRYEDYPLDLRTTLYATELGENLFKWYARLSSEYFKATRPETRPYMGDRQELWKSAEQVNNEAIAWIDGRADSKRPFFLFLNYFDAHHPYVTPEGTSHRFGKEPKTVDDFRAIIPHRSRPPEDPAETELIVDSYDNCIAYADLQIGSLLNQLEQRGLGENTWFVITSDHGELLGEHGLFGHSKSLFEPALRVPLILIPPRDALGNQRPIRLKMPVALRDLPATLAAALLPKVASPFPGQSLARFYAPENGAVPEPAPILAEIGGLNADDRGERSIAKYGRLRAVIDGPAKLIDRYAQPSYEQQFALDADPEEKHDLSEQPEAREQRDRLRERLEEFYKGVPRTVLDRLEG